MDTIISNLIYKNLYFILNKKFTDYLNAEEVENKANLGALLLHDVFSALKTDIPELSDDDYSVRDIIFQILLNEDRMNRAMSPLYTIPKLIERFAKIYESDDLIFDQLGKAK